MAAMTTEGLALADEVYSNKLKKKPCGKTPSLVDVRFKYSISLWPVMVKATV